ncbi:MAG: exodeoxyribonuclease VII large subunit [Verrucomicrobiales bacterium]|nr:exodeoxyribonuclease VII large subunit [Verrucomicrobiales bacterium]
MNRQFKSQWDFGELFAAAAAARRVLTVSELTSQIRRLLEAQIGSVWVTGEVSNLRAQASGHIYFTLKDESAQLNCVLFRGEAPDQRALLRDGQSVLVFGDITVYEPRGQYQLVVRAIELQGIGALQIKFEQLKRKLAAEGLFAPERKRPIPKYPQRIGLVTSPTGAAIRDVLHIVRARNPSLHIVFVPCRVQGEGAAEEIAAAIRLLNEYNNTVRAHEMLDLILVTRGGGSLEDLWAFNEEVVARAIFESAVPVISAVGHEIDFTISDFVADLRAATPTAAAEIVTEGVYSSRRFLADAPALMRQRLQRRLTARRELAQQLTKRFERVHPRRYLNELLQRLDELQLALSRVPGLALSTARLNCKNMAERLGRVHPRKALQTRTERLVQTTRWLRERCRALMRAKTEKIGRFHDRLRLLGPEHVLARGYSITTDAATGTVLRDVGQVKSGQRVRTRLAKGEFFSRIE